MTGGLDCGRCRVHMATCADKIGMAGGRPGFHRRAARTRNVTDHHRRPPSMCFSDEVQSSFAVTGDTARRLQAARRTRLDTEEATDVPVRGPSPDTAPVPERGKTPTEGAGERVPRRRPMRRVASKTGERVRRGRGPRR